MLPVFDALNLRDPASVISILEAGAVANVRAACRVGSIDVIGPFEVGEPGSELIATGDLHDNPLHLARLMVRANLADPAPAPRRSHLTLHELIHSDDIANATDFSYRVLVRAAALKSAFPEYVHLVLANHEIAQLTGSEVVKEGVRCVEAFDAGLDAVFGDSAGPVRDALRAFIRSMPLALRIRAGDAEEGRRDILCAHSLPDALLMDRFDATVLDRELTDDDFVPRRGAAHLMTWGRGFDAAHLANLGGRWNVDLFILGHDKAENGWQFTEPNCLILNSDHANGVYVPIDLAAPLRTWARPGGIAAKAVRLADG